MGYYAQAVRGHLQIVHRQQPIAELLQQPQPPEPLKAKLRLVLALREFAAQELKLPVNGHYLRYADLGRSNVVWNVTATPEFSMTPKDWWYPVVGRLAYRGYFVERAARRQAVGLAAQGFDVDGISMGGDIAVAAAGVDRRIIVVSTCVATPDWLRPGSFEPPGEPDAAAQADYDRRNPLTHLLLYAHRPAIAFQSGAADKQVPPDGGTWFVAALQPLSAETADRLVVNLEPDVPHRFTPRMLEHSVQWFAKHLKP